MEFQVTKFHATILAMVFAWLFWIEHGHRIRIGVETEQTASSNTTNDAVSNPLTGYAGVYRTIR